MRDKNACYEAAIRKELKIVEKREEALRRMAAAQNQPKWKSVLKDKIPQKVYDKLQKAFCKAFELIFEKGTGIIEKTYNRESIHDDYAVYEFAFRLKADRRTLKKLRKSVRTVNLKNMAVTGAEGAGLGVLGIGLPDIVVFVGILLKGIYEVALRYGFRYDLEEERYFILKLMETAMLKGDFWEKGNREIDNFMNGEMSGVEKAENLPEQIRKTADAFALDMILMKFIQGFPVVGIVGGAGNPLYYGRVMKYVEIKYRKRYLLNALSAERQDTLE